MSDDTQIQEDKEGGRWPRHRKIKFSRDTLLFVGGFMGVIHETLLTKGDRPYLITAFVTMMGVPAFLRRDEK